MPTKGNLITKDNFSTDISETCVYNHDSGGNNSTYYWYVSAACWRMRMRLSKNWGSWGRTNTMYADYWNGSSWVRAMTVSRSRSQTSSGETNDYMYHNWPGAATSGDVINASLWRLVYDAAELYHRYIYIATGGPGAMGPTDYANNWKNKKIYSNGNLGAFLYNNGSAQSDDAARSYFKNSNNRGTQISAANGDHCVYTDYYF